MFQGAHVLGLCMELTYTMLSLQGKIASCRRDSALALLAGCQLCT